MRVRRYETVFVLPPDLDDGRTREIVERLENVVDQQGGTLVRREDWGVRKLAYEIKRCSRGHYFLLDYAGPAQVVSELERHIKMIESILRFLTVKKEDAVDMEEIKKEQAEEQEKEEAKKAAAEKQRLSEEKASEEAAEREKEEARKAAAQEQQLSEEKVSEEVEETPVEAAEDDGEEEEPSVQEDAEGEAEESEEDGSKEE